MPSVLFLLPPNSTQLTKLITTLSSLSSMAATIIARRSTTVSNLFDKLRLSSTLRPLAASRSFNTASEERSIARRGDDEHVPAPRRYRGGPDLFPGFFGDVFDPFGTRRSLSDVFNLMDQMMDLPFTSPRGSAGFRRGWDVKEDENALHLKIDMPGLGKEDVKVAVDKNTLVIKGEAPAEGGEASAGSEEGDDGGAFRRRYSTRIDLPVEQYDVQGIKAEMKNGVLRVVIPKLKEEEGKGVHHVQIE